jgi:hypothetical protein
MVAWDVCTMPKEEGGLGFIDVMNKGDILAAIWIARCIKRSARWQIL